MHAKNLESECVLNDADNVDSQREKKEIPIRKEMSPLEYARSNWFGSCCVGCGCMTMVASPFAVYGLYQIASYFLE